MRCIFYLFLIIVCIEKAVIAKDACESCVPVEECPEFQNMDKSDKIMWMERHPCDNIPMATTRCYDGFSATAKGDQICCPENNIWNVEEKQNAMTNTDADYKNYKTVDIEYKIQRNSNIGLSSTQEKHNQNNIPDDNKYKYQNINRNIVKRQIFQQTPPVQTQNPIFQIRPILPKVQIPNSRNDNAGTNTDQQCTVQMSLPPNPETGCCGRDTSDADRITDLVSFVSTTRAPSTINWQQYFSPRQNQQQTNRPQPSPGIPNIANQFSVPVQTWIAGGNETNLEQFPWTVLLEVLFNYGDRMVGFTCGGSLISSRYILTAAHCVNEAGAQISGIEITLAEYDKRTFPNDCITTAQGQRCIQNVVIPAESVVVHPQYEPSTLNNDIALIRLQGFAPYTNFIRPICLTPVDLDLPNFQNLPLSVAGWGQDMQYSTNVKQSTILNLVPQDQCRRFYPNLARSHICAAGTSGEDTCKGDSGGPLMVLFRGSYYVIGVVSGKRADSPCGTAVPTLFTNVFNYLNWIQSVIRN